MATKAGLTRAAVLDAAAVLADEQGFEALTLTALATRLGVTTPTLYYYFPGLPGLRRELALLSLRAQEEAFGRAVMGRAGPDALRALADTYRAYVKAHPGLYATSVRAAGHDDELGAAQTRVVEIALRALAACTLSADDAIHAVRMLRSIVHGFATLELAGGFGLPQEVDETFRRLVAGYLGMLEPQRKDR
jgi:AcrR family transcriptional regulator